MQEVSSKARILVTEELNLRSCLNFSTVAIQCTEGNEGPTSGFSANKAIEHTWYGIRQPRENPGEKIQHIHCKNEAGHGNMDIYSAEH